MVGAREAVRADPCAGSGIASYCSALPHSGGQAVAIGASGAPSIAANELELGATGGIAGQPALFIYGTGPVALPFGDGIRCVAAPIFRLGPPAPFAPGGTLTRALDLGSPPLSSGPGAATPGGMLFFQLWYRDPAAGMSGFNLSDGLSVG